MGLLKNYLLLFSICSFLGVTDIYADNIPYEKSDFHILVYEFEGLTFTVDRDAATKIKRCFYNNKNGDFHVASEHLISYVQIFDPEGKLFFQLPIENSEVHLDIDDFEIGAYEINFKFVEQSEMTRSTLIKKQ